VQPFLARVCFTLHDHRTSLGGQSFEPMQVLTPSGLEHIKAHKYVGGKYTPLDNILNHWWYCLTDLLPIWFAPNLVTLSGFLPLVAWYALSWSYCPTGKEVTPSWLLLSGSVALFWYQTMDAMDGKQARRTQSSTPLGQLFDHGCDCLATMSHHSQAIAILTSGGSVLALLGLTTLQTAFFMAQWEEYHTGVLQTAVGPIGVTETQYGLILGLLAAGLAGPTRLSAFLGGTLPGLGDRVTVGEGVMLGWAALVFIMCLLCFVRTLRVAYTKGSAGVAALQILPVVILNALCLAIPPLARQALCKLIYFSAGLHFFHITAQMIVFSMAKQKFPTMQWPLLAFGILAGLTFFLDIRQLEYAFKAHAVVFGAYVLGWLLVVIQQITSKLEVQIFKIKRKGS